MADLSDFKRGQIVGARMAGESNKNCWIFCCGKEYCLESNFGIWEIRKNLLTKGKLWKKAKDVWLGMLDSYVDCKEGSQEYCSENYSRA